MSLNVWTYWEGQKPQYISVCLSTMASACMEAGVKFHFLHPGNVDQFLPKGALDPSYRQLPQPALKADCLRAALLAAHGGWWWDADTVAFRSPKELTEHQYPGAEALYMTWDKAPRRALNGYIYFKPGSSLALEWLAQVNHILQHKRGEAIWCALGENLLTPLMDMHPGAVHEIDRRLFLPIDIDSEVAKFFEPGNPEEYIGPMTVCFGLNHSWFWYHKGPEIRMSPKEWGKSPLLIHRLLYSTRFRP